MTKPLDLLVDRRVLLDVGITLRDVGLWLVVVVIRNEVLHRVVRQKLAKFVCQLGGQRLVRRHDQGRALELLDQPGCRRTLASSRCSKQDDVLLACLDPLGYLSDCRGLITSRLVFTDHLERRNSSLQVSDRAGHDLTLRGPPDTSSHSYRPALVSADCNEVLNEGEVNDAPETAAIFADCAVNVS